MSKKAVWTAYSRSRICDDKQFSILAPATFGKYSASVFNGTSRTSLALRADIPYVGWFIVAAAVLLALSAVSYTLRLYKEKDALRRLGDSALYAAIVTQAAGIVALVYQLKTLEGVLSLIDRSQYPRFGAWMMERQDVPIEQINSMGEQQLYDLANKWITENATQLHLSVNANPVELAALITAFGGTFFVIVFGIRTGKLRTLLPSQRSSTT